MMKRSTMALTGGVVLGSVGAMLSVPAAGMPASDLSRAADGITAAPDSVAYRVRQASRPVYVAPRITYGYGDQWWYTPGWTGTWWYGPGGSAGWYRPAWSVSGWYGPRWFGGGFGPRPWGWGYRSVW